MFSRNLRKVLVILKKLWEAQFSTMTQKKLTMNVIWTFQRLKCSSEDSWISWEICVRDMGYLVVCQGLRRHVGLLRGLFLLDGGLTGCLEPSPGSGLRETTTHIQWRWVWSRTSGGKLGFRCAENNFSCSEQIEWLHVCLIYQDYFVPAILMMK